MKILFTALFLLFLFNETVINVGHFQYISPWNLNGKSKSENKPSILSESSKRYAGIAEEFYRNELLPSKFNGAMLVAKGGNIIFEKYSGFQHLEVKDLIDENSSFHLASVSKTFTGMAICKLWEEGKLNLTDSVSNYLIGFNYPGVTIKTLLNHRSGLPNYVHTLKEKEYLGKKMITNQDVLTFLIKNRKSLPVGRPDRDFNYCNTNYALLALIIENVSGMTFSQYLTTTFFDPLEMKHTFVFTPDMEDKVMPSYNWKSQKEPFMYLDGVYGDKNIYSTPRDMLKWDSVLTFGKMFKPETLEAAYKGYSNEKTGIKNYGLGWRLYLYPNNKKIIYHNGWWHGNNTFFSRMVNDSVTIIVLGNRFNKHIYETRKLYAAFGSRELNISEEE
jgi:CubicO group peptidase (beta-lactamase class C family)